MMDRWITQNRDGSTTLVDGDRTITIASDVQDRDAQIAAFFPPEVPASVTPLQMRKALRAVGLKPAVDAFVAALGDEEAVEEWEYALAIERGNPMLNNAAAQLGMTEAQVDDLFRLAAGMT
jgi:hypothetical protein